MILDYLWLLPLLGVSFGQQSSGGQSSETVAKQTGLSAGQSPILSAYTEPGLENLYNWAANRLGIGPTVQTGGAIQGYSGQVPSGFGYMAGQQLGPMSGNYAGPGGQYYNATSGNIRLGSPEGYAAGQSTEQPFQLPGLDQNGLYAGQTSSVDALLNRAYGGLKTTGAGGAAVTQSVLPQLLSTIGAQTTAGAMVPEQVRQQRVQDVNAVLQLISAGLGGSSAGSGFKTFSGNEFDMSLAKGAGNMWLGGEI